MAAFYWVIKCDCKTITCSTLCIYAREHTHTHTSHANTTHLARNSLHNIMHAQNYACIFNELIHILPNQIKSNRIKSINLGIHSCIWIRCCCRLYICMSVSVYVLYGFMVFFSFVIFIIYQNLVCPLDHTGWRVGIQTAYTCEDNSIGCLVSLLLLLQLLFLFLFLFVCSLVRSYLLLLIVCKPSFDQ